jgi:predicted ABC-type ATPase
VKEIILFGGPNGAGKSTAAKVLLPQYLDLFTFLTADEIARQIAPADPESVALTAGRRLIPSL